MLASFNQTNNAFHAAIAIQRSHVKSALSVRVGFHYGEVIPDEGDIYGNAVNLAARVTGYANASEIFTTEDTVAHLSALHQAHAYYLDQIDFKGVDNPMPVYRINWSEESEETTEIVAAVSRTSGNQATLLLKLMLGARSVSLDPDNPLLKIGRAVDNDFIVHHNSTSRNHAQVEFLSGRYQLTDSSTNGTYVVRAGRNPLFIRRESVFLEDSGLIGLGWVPSPDDKQAVRFRVTSENLVHN